jgi:hypothetical protein
MPGALPWNTLASPVMARPPRVACHAPMRMSAYPSPSTSPALDTALPKESPADAPAITRTGVIGMPVALP